MKPRVNAAIAVFHAKPPAELARDIRVLERAIQRQQRDLAAMRIARRDQRRGKGVVR